MDTVATGIGAAAVAGVKDLQDPAKTGAILAAASSLTDAIVTGLNAAKVFKRSDAGQA